uniref:Uncharacterized protein n=1 Tax=Oryza nivara TaxID=4536 RepID=A0A0E0GED9_ORYNI
MRSSTVTAKTWEIQSPGGMAAGGEAHAGAVGRGVQEVHGEPVHRGRHGSIELEKKRADRKLRELDREPDANPLAGLLRGLARD